MERAYAPYSGYHVGAALRTLDGKVYSGCNIENSSFGATVCAERVAVFKAVSEGEGGFAAIAVVSRDDPRVLPCGICRQVLWELAGDIDVVVGRASSVEVLKLSSLYPDPFKKS
ncbi:MAG: cytidine deaminase, partial [Deltaproteobacteria bacterium]|nr:cytidine deaminase [Deltaproteobacteria bacterium]MCC7344945.1 cytidine deaminase [Deltaproteobacteria bacterium]